MISIKGEYVFHVHSWRCCHADEIRDEEYVKRAELRRFILRTILHFRGIHFATE